jgi:hypothetical protein
VEHFSFSHYRELADWFKRREMAVPALEDLPKVGFVIPGVAAGFLVQTDTPGAELDFFISNPEKGRRHRALALDSIVESLTAHAKSLGYRFLKCSSQINTIRKRARYSGFRELGDFSCFIKEL